MSRRYLISLLVMTLVLVLASFVVLWVAPEKFLVAMPLLALYFGVVSGVQHFLVSHAMCRSPKTFVQIFLATVVGMLFLHIVVLAAYLLTHPAHARLFTVAFLVGYVVSLVFETVALVQFVNNERNKHRQS